MSQKYRVVITDFISGDLSPEQQILGGLATVEALDAHSPADLVGKIEDVDGIMLYHNLALREETLKRLTKCRIIVRCGVGVDNIDRPFARSKGITLANVPDYGTEEVADSALALTLSLLRGTHTLNSILQENPQACWSYSHVAPLHRIRGKTFGMVALGRIGIAAALRAKAFGMRVVFYDPYVSSGMDKALGIERADTLDELLRQSFVLSIHCPLTPETHHLIGKKELERMPAGGYLVNTARGAVVDSAAVIESIANGHLAGAGLDVLAQEPPPADDPLIVAWRDPKHPVHHRVIINPHSAFYSVEGLMDMRIKGAQAIRKAFMGQPVPNIVDW